MLQAQGYTVKQIAPHFVKPDVKSNKNDPNDAEAICEAMSRPSMRFVVLKTVEQQDIQAVHRVRSGLMDQRKAKANQLRGLASEYGLVVPEELLHLRAIGQIAWQDPVAIRLQQVRGIGPLTATALLATVGDASQFAGGREMAASFGLTPKRSSSGGKERLLGISKRGDAYLRSLLVHGARAVIRTAQAKTDRLSIWVLRIATARHPNIAAVALANKTARIA